MGADLAQLPAFVAIEDEDLKSLQSMMERIDSGEVTSLLCCYYDKMDNTYHYINACGASDRIVMASLIQHRALKAYIET